MHNALARDAAMSNRAAVPPATLVGWLGYGGLIPFVVLTALLWVDPDRRTFWRVALVDYGAVILSFVGALHWAFAMTLESLSPKRRRALFVWSVVPCLLGWLALLLPSVWSELLLIAGFVLHYAQDRRLNVVCPLPSWYLPLRLRLSVVAVASLLAAAAVLS